MYDGNIISGEPGTGGSTGYAMMNVNVHGKSAYFEMDLGKQCNINVVKLYRHKNITYGPTVIGIQIMQNL